MQEEQTRRFKAITFVCKRGLQPVLESLLPVPDNTEVYNISRCGLLYITCAQKYLTVFTTTVRPRYAVFYIVTRYSH